MRVTSSGADLPATRHDGDLVLWFVESGAASLVVGDDRRRLTVGDAVNVPAGVEVALSDCTGNLSFYEVTVPA